MNDIIPDGFTPVVGWRAWTFSGNYKLLSPNVDGVPWTAGQPMRATCMSRPDPLASLPWSPNDRHLIGTDSTFDQTTGEHYVTVGALRVVVSAPTKKVLQETPAEGCNCGFHAAKSVDKARKYGPVIGRVALWGKVIVHEEGWRGEYAYPQALYSDENVEMLRAYGVPVLPTSELPRPSDEHALALTVHQQHMAQHMAYAAALLKRPYPMSLPATVMPPTSLKCPQCGHEQYLHGHSRFGCLRCPIKYRFGFFLKKSCEWVAS